MAKASKDTATDHETLPGYEGHFAQLDGYTVAFERYTEDADLAPMFKGLPDDRCQCPHRGVVLKGALVYRSAGGEERIGAGEAYYVGPGHTPQLTAGTEVVEFSPSEELQKTLEIVMNNMGGRRVAGPSASEPAEDGDDLAVDRDILGVEVHLVEIGVRRPEHDLVAAAEEGLHGALLAGDTGHDGVAAVGRGLLADDDVVAVEDAGADHRVAPHADHEELAAAGEVLGEGQALLDVLGREHAGAGRDVADERHVADRPPLDRSARLDVVADLDGAWLGVVAGEVALVLEGGEVGVDGGAR